MIAIFTVYGSCRKDHKPPDPGKVITGNNTIVYTDVHPDSTIYAVLSSTYGTAGEHYDLDLNNDGVKDFELRVYAISSRGGGERPLRGAHATVSTIYYTSDKKVAIESRRIDLLDSLGSIGASSESWMSGSINLLGANIVWARDTAFLGLKLIKGSDTYYGWVRLAGVLRTGFTLGATITVLDYAYNSTPNAPILAGQTK